MPPLLRAWPISGSLGVASGSTSRSPSKPPSPVVARPTPSRVRQPSRPPPCGSTKDRHQAAPRQDARATSPEDRVSGSLPMRRCGGAYRREPRALRHYNGRAIVRSIVRQTPSSPILARWCDHAPVARSPESAVTSWHPESNIPFFQLLHTQMLVDRRHASNPPTHGDPAYLLRKAA